MRRTAKILVFLLTIGLVGGALIGVATYLTQSSSTAHSNISLGLCSLSAPDKALLGVYLETRASDLKRPAGVNDRSVLFVIESGEAVTSIAERLQREGLVSDAELFRRYVRYHNLDSGIQAGEFQLRQTMTIEEVAQALQEGHRRSQQVTIREGLRLEEVAAEVARQTTIPAEDFQGLVTDGWRQLGLGYEFLSDIPESATLEGFLWPDTYQLPEGATANDLLLRMLQTFDARVTPDLRAAGRSNGLDTYELITLASIIEREAILDQERPLIASVYYNRLQAGWLLGADPTVQYGLGQQADWWSQLSVEDLSLNLDYSTYVHTGLPPGPICSPGLASVEAAARPAQTDYFFFLADCERDNGSHLFSATEAEHFANYARCGGQP